MLDQGQPPTPCNCPLTHGKRHPVSPWRPKGSRGGGHNERIRWVGFVGQAGKPGFVLLVAFFISALFILGLPRSCQRLFPSPSF